MLGLGRPDAGLRKLICETVPHLCRDCMSVARTMTNPLIKIKLATRFNHRVQADLFFIFNLTFLCLLDECIRFAVSSHLPSKEPESILQVILFSWIQYFGPMEILAFDQEGGITTNMAAIMCEKFNITRGLGGSQGHGAAPIGERRLSLIKLASLKAGAMRTGAEFFLTQRSMFQSVPWLLTTCWCTMGIRQAWHVLERNLVTYTTLKTSASLRFLAR